MTEPSSDIRSSILISGKHEGANVQDLSGPDLWEAARGSFYDFQDNNLCRSEKRRRSATARQKAWQTAQAGKDRDNEYPRF